MQINVFLSFVVEKRYYKVFNYLKTNLHRQSAQLKEGHAKLPVYLLGSLQHLLPAHPFYSSSFLVPSKEQAWILAQVSLTASPLILLVFLFNSGFKSR